MKELNIGDTVYHIKNTYNSVETFIITEKTVSEKCYLNKYTKEISYVAFKHPCKILFKDTSLNFIADDGSLIFSSKEDLLNHITTQVNNAN